MGIKHRIKGLERRVGKEPWKCHMILTTIIPLDDGRFRLDYCECMFLGTQKEEEKVCNCKDEYPQYYDSWEELQKR